MLKKLKNVMLYVEDTNSALEFWTQKMDFTVKEELSLMENFKGYKVAPDENSETSLVIFPIAFIEKYSPEVSLETPSLMFEVENIEAVYEDLKERDVYVGELVEIPAMKTFNFFDGQDNYFAVSEAV
ncbi:VOC family protein [Jeotgalicoccus nanhaiensis]|uniref:VOC family protein n=1 Tax=Jeotgalicoccus nanhaiensis TaxID=568603 RepID=A0ABR9XZX1_9STAP|nr:VOC family protein [Jeotgalicoccus nanhaiensis]MBF0754447.1 VOC family protein [Jeotgalicoccus nanhaiensis]TFU61152.1 VOC family protein [Jeotgalicoccus nanhaiensis]